MKNINNFITEKHTGDLKGSSFKYNVKYSKKDFDKWVELWKDDKLYKKVMITPYGKDALYGKDAEFVLIYWINQKQIEHIGYQLFEQINLTCLVCDVKNNIRQIIF